MVSFRRLALPAFIGFLLGLALMVPLPTTSAQSPPSWPIQAPPDGVLRTDNRTASSLAFHAWNATTGAYTKLLELVSGTTPTLQLAPFYLTASVWDDLVAPAGAINPLGADGQMTVISDAAGYLGCLQADATGETAVIQWQLPHSIKDASNIHPHIHYFKNDASDNTGAVTFQGKFRHCPVTGTCGDWSAFADGSTEVAPGDVAGASGVADWELADSTYNFNISSILLMQVKRTTGTTGSVAVCSADLHFERDSLGSLSEWSR